MNEHPENTGQDVEMMRLALTQARQAAQMGEVPIGAIVYRRDQILSRAHNLRESHQDPTAHAEIIALREAADALGQWRLPQCALAVTLEPCPMCAGAIVNARIGRLIYGAADPKAGAVRSLYEICDDTRLNHRVPITSGVLAPECRDVLHAFFKERRGLNSACEPRDRITGGDAHPS